MARNPDNLNIYSEPSINSSFALAARMKETVGDRKEADEWHALTAFVESECRRISVGVSAPVGLSQSASSAPKGSARAEPRGSQALASAE